MKLRPAALALPLAALLLSSCVAGEDSSGAAPAAAGGDDAAATASADTLDIDFATYNPLSLVIKDQGWLEAELQPLGVTVNWVQSAGSNKANEFLRNGNIDIGSTAGAAALLARSNGSPIQTIDIYSQPNWSGVVVRGDSDIDSVEDLRGRSIAATTGTDPYFFLLQALETGDLTAQDVTLQNLQHADGRAALDSGQVDAWAGLDPIMAAAEAESGDKIIYENIDFNSYGFLNATEEFLEASPDLAQTVVNAYERARAWVQENPEETARILSEVSGTTPEVATAVIERTNFDVDPAPGDDQRAVLEKIGPVFVANGDVPDQAQVDEALDSLFEPQFAEDADPDAIDAPAAG